MAWDDILDDPEFQGQDQATKTKVATNYFSQNFEQDFDFQAQTPEIKERVRSNFMSTLAFSPAIDQDFARGAEGFAPPALRPSPERTVLGTAKDIGISALSGAIALPESIVGLADIPTGGRVGKFLETVGFRPAEARRILEEELSPAQKEAGKKVAEAEGFFPTVKEAIKSPSVIAKAAIESAPSILGGAGIARGVLGLAPKISPIIAAAIGEGAISAGAAAEQIRTEEETGLLEPRQAAAAAVSGAITGIIGVAGGRLAQKFGVTDVDTFLAQSGSKLSEKGVVRRLLEGGISEGLFEELPQSAQEQVWMNVAQEQPLLQGVDKQAAIGLLTGAAIGSSINILGAVPKAEEKADIPEVQALPKEVAERIVADQTISGKTAKDVATYFANELPPTKSAEESAKVMDDLLNQAGIGVSTEEVQNIKARLATGEIIGEEPIVPAELDVDSLNIALNTPPFQRTAEDRLEIKEAMKQGVDVDMASVFTGRFAEAGLAPIGPSPIESMTESLETKLEAKINTIEPKTDLGNELLDTIKEQVVRDKVEPVLAKPEVIEEVAPEIPAVAEELPLPEAAPPITPEVVEEVPTTALPLELEIEEGVATVEEASRQILENIKTEVEAGEVPKGLKKKPTLIALNKALAGKKLAPKQELLIKDLHDSFIQARPESIGALQAEIAERPAIAPEPVEKVAEMPFERARIGKSPQPHKVLKELEATPEEIALGERFFEVENEKTGEVTTVAFEDLQPIKKRIITEEARDKAKSNIKSKLGRLTAGVDPTLLKDYAVIGAYHFESGLRTFSAWGKKMIEEFGDSIKPHLNDLWKQAKVQVPKDAEVVPEVEPAKKPVKPKKPEVKAPAKKKPTGISRTEELRKKFGAGPMPLKETTNFYDTTKKEMEQATNEVEDDFKKGPEFKEYTNETEKGRKGYVAKAQDIIDRLSPLGTLPEKTAYLKARYAALGRIAKIDQSAKDIYKMFRKSGEHAPDIFSFLTTKDAKPSSIKDAKLRKDAVEVKKLLIKTGEDLVKRGLLKQETFDSMKGAYLPRLYLRHLMPEGAFTSMAGGKKPSDMGWAKKRKDIPEDVRRLILGEITDPGFLAAKGFGVQNRDMAMLDWLGEIAQNRKWVADKALVEWKGKPVTAFWLTSEAAQIRKQAVHYTEKDKREALKLANQMDEIVNKLPDEYKATPEGHKRFPDTPRYGALRGLAVRKEIYDDIIGATTMHTGDTSIAEQILGHGGLATKATQLWKWSKVAANPPGQIRNFVSNGILLHLSGVPFHRVPQRVIEAIQDIRKDGKFWKVAKEYGVTESTFSAQELGRIERELLDVEARRAGTISLATLRNMAGKIMDVTGDMYQMSESIFKTAKIIDEMKKGKSPDVAALEAQKWLFDYSLITPSMRYLRNAPIGVPFLTFYLKALPRLIETMVTRPWAFAPYLAIPYVMTQMIANMQDVDDEDVDKLRKALPRWLEEKGHAYILPAKDEKGRWQAIDMGYFFPWATWSSMAAELGKGEFDKAIMSTGLFGGPVGNIVAAMQTNVDPFTKRKIVNELDPPARKAAALFNYGYRMAAPTWLTDIGFAGHMYRALSGEVDKYGEAKTTKVQAALRLVGVNLYPIDPIRTRATNIRWMRFEISETKKRRNQLLKDRNLTAKERESIKKEYNRLIQRRRDELKTYAEESRVRPELR